MAVGSRCWDRCPEGCGRLGDKCPRLMPPLTKGISLAASGSGLAPVLQALAALKETPDLLAIAHYLLAHPLVLSNC